MNLVKGKKGLIMGVANERSIAWGISKKLAEKRVAKVTDVVKEGDEVKVKVIGFDRGKVKLSMKQAAE